MIDTAALVARAYDRFAAGTAPDYVSGYLEHVVPSSTTAKARLLHHFLPPSTGGTAGDRDGNGGDGGGEANTELDSWCGTHVDLNYLTGLTSAMYVDETARPLGRSGSVELPELEVGPPDKDTGLYIKDRAGRGQSGHAVRRPGFPDGQGPRAYHARALPPGPAPAWRHLFIRGIPVARVCDLLFINRCMRPEGPWQRLAAAFAGSSGVFIHSLILAQTDNRQF